MPASDGGLFIIFLMREAAVIADGTKIFYTSKKYEL